ncbi:NAD-dependent epimerase/dehydratase family protein [Streptomyces chrestomyceticus]|uniref:NAD-dependent epimerase/dehydratase family protein n=1 Tax=Streptomyces chrestomyceticus TaxID=68185 RepID=UPI0027DD370B|nr:NAD-dependent epimerase/dehydratase family protein [Streptomyces chrestomyceticus]
MTSSSKTLMTPSVIKVLDELVIGGQDSCMKILVMGGTWFLGRAVAEEALRRGWKVSTFNRGRSGPDVRGVQPLRGDRTEAEDLAELSSHGPWDAVVDTSSAELPPKGVLTGARALKMAAERYVYVSTVNAYRGWPSDPLTEASELLDGPPDADADYGRLPEDWDGPDWYYGRQKAGAERAVLQAFGEKRSVLLRPGVILGPGEYVGRLPWWLRRAERGGRVLAPGLPSKPIQPVDVRDVAAFALDQAAASVGGAYNVVAPIGQATMGGFLDACLEATGHRGHLSWVPDTFLIEAGVKQWTELPLWRTHAGVWNIASERAQAAGLVCRPLAETVEATWQWLLGGGLPVAHPRADEHGIEPRKEQRLLEEFDARATSGFES